MVGLGFWVSGSGFRVTWVQGYGFRNYGSSNWHYFGLGLMVSEAKGVLLRLLGCGAQGSGFAVYGFRV